MPNTNNNMLLRTISLTKCVYLYIPDVKLKSASCACWRSDLLGKMPRKSPMLPGSKLPYKFKCSAYIHVAMDK